MYNLNRSSHLDLDDNTPDLVVVDLLSTCNKKVNEEFLKTRRKEIIQCITSFERDMDISKPDMRKIATFVSPKSQRWTMYNLWKAFHHLDSFLTSPPGYEGSSELKHLRPCEIGDKNETNPLSYDSIMLYIIMQHNDIPYVREDDIHTMREKINEKYERLNRKASPPPVLKSPVVVKDEVKGDILFPDDFDVELGIQKIINTVKSQTDETVWEMTQLLKETPHFNFDDCDQDELKKIASSIKSHGTIYRSCLNDAEAVIYGIRFFSIDFSESTHPTLEIKKYCQAKIDGKKFKPVSHVWKDRYLLNRGWYNTEKHYNPKLHSYYTQKSSEKLISYNGGSDDDTLDFFEQIEDDNTFYMGVPPLTIATGGTISFFENRDLDPQHDSFVTYGNLKRGDFIYLTPKELKEYFESQKDFSDFRDRNKEIPFHAIRKLRNICKDNRSEEGYSSLLERVGFFYETGKPNFPLLKELFSQYLIYPDDLERYFHEFHASGKAPAEMPGGSDLKNVLENLPLLTYNGTRYFRRREKMITANAADDDELKSTLVYYYEAMTNEKFSSSKKEKKEKVKDKKKEKELVFEERGEGEIEKLERMMGF